MATMNVLDAAGFTVAVEKPLTPGQAAMAASSPVVIASDQSAVPVTVSGVATAANQTTGNTSLATIATNTGAGATAANQTSELTKLDTLHTDLIAATPAGTNIIGKVGIDQTTPGTTNAVAITGGTVASATADSGNPVKVGGIYNSTMPTFTNGQRGDLQLSAKGAIYATLTDTSGNTISRVQPSVDGASTASSGLLVAAYGFVFNGTTWDRLTTPNLVSRIASCAATTNATSGKASAGKVHTIHAYNTTASLKYLKLYNKASAPTVGTDTPVMTIALPPTGNFILEVPNGGMYFATGIAYALTGAAADADATALAAGDVVGLNISYS